MKTRPLTEADRVKLRQQFPAVYKVVLAAEILAGANADHKAAIYSNRRGKHIDNVVFAENTAVEAVAMLVRAMQEGA